MGIFPAFRQQFTLVWLAFLFFLRGGCSGPIPDLFYDDDLPTFIGCPAVPHPLPPKGVPPHPLLSRTSSIHCDAYNSDVEDYPGPLGVNPQVTTAFIGICPIIMFDDNGLLIAVSLDLRVIGMGITAIDPDTLEVIDRYAVPIDWGTLLGGGAGSQGVSVNGGYFHVDAQGRAIVGTQDNRFEILALQTVEADAREWQVISSLDLQPYLADGDFLIDTQYDWLGNVWFVSGGGTVGYIDHADETVHTIQLAAEFIENGVAVAEDGVYVLSSEAAYRFEIDAATRAPQWSWREAYDRGTVAKPGTFALGSGSAPTLLGDDLIAFTDNADTQVNLLVYRREKDYVGDRQVCSLPLFTPDASAVDVSVIGYGNSIIVENIYNAGSFLDDYRELAPGLTRIDVRPDRSGCDVVWTRDIRSTTVPKLSTANGLIYTYTQLLTVPNPVDAYYLTAIDFATGATVWRVLTGTGFFKNNSFGAIAIGPNGTVYQGVLGGFIAVRDGSPP